MLRSPFVRCVYLGRTCAEYLRRFCFRALCVQCPALSRQVCRPRARWVIGHILSVLRGSAASSVFLFSSLQVRMITCKKREKEMNVRHAMGSYLGNVPEAEIYFR